MNRRINPDLNVFVGLGWCLLFDILAVVAAYFIGKGLGII